MKAALYEKTGPARDVLKVTEIERPEPGPGEYGTRVATVEPGGAEFIPLRDRHGSPIQLLWTWTSPNMRNRPRRSAPNVRSTRAAMPAG